MTQIAGLLAVAIGLWTLNICILLSGRGGGYTRDKTTYAGTLQELELHEGVGVIAGFYGTCILHHPQLH